MNTIVLEHKTDFDGWRQAARTLVLDGVKPEDVMWRIRGDEELFALTETTLQPQSSAETFSVSARFVELAKIAILHRDRERFAVLYRLLWRLRGDHDLLDVATDPDVIRVTTMAKAVRYDEHKMHAFVRFREIGREREARYVAWFEPKHHIIELAAPFFARRFADMPWSILTPDLCAHWDGFAISFTPGVSKAEAPTSDRQEETWRRYYATIFNPARLKVKTMQTEMPKKYGRNLPEASMIRPLIAKAATEPHMAQRRLEEPMKRKTVTAASELETLREEAAACRACPLWKDATQTVFGEGPPHAPIMLVGEQPGDKEDLAGKPFVGPAGQMLDRALIEAGIDRKLVYVTNAVKHFKFLARGKIRLHQKPATPEIRACRPWYERERTAIKPMLVVAMGATAAQGVFGKITPINKNRSHLIDLDEKTKALVTVHPSYLLRLPDADAKAREYERFVDDLKMAAAFLRKSAHAA